MLSSWSHAMTHVSNLKVMLLSWSHVMTQASNLKAIYAQSHASSSIFFTLRKKSFTYWSILFVDNVGKIQHGDMKKLQK
jgi:hypothetical protein